MQNIQNNIYILSHFICKTLKTICAKSRCNKQVLQFCKMPEMRKIRYSIDYSTFFSFLFFFQKTKLFYLIRKEYFSIGSKNKKKKKNVNSNVTRT